jgi:predicted DCC family thiol-disulfide oxidoreductase YuxK
MNHLKKYDSSNHINLINIHQDNFQQLHPEINAESAMKILHGFYEGELLLGLAVTYRAWTLVGKGFWVAPLNWPIIKTISHWVYLGLAKFRHPISALLAKLFGLPTTQCSSGTCYDNSANTHHRRK